MTFDLLFILALAALVVGPKKAAEMGKDFMRWKTKLTAMTGDFRSTLEQEFRNMEAEQARPPRAARVAPEPQMELAAQTENFKGDAASVPHSEIGGGVSPEPGQSLEVAQPTAPARSLYNSPLFD